MGGETLRSTLGLQDHQKHLDRQNPFSLAYRIEAIIPVNISMPTLQVGVVHDQNDALLHLMLDHSEEIRQLAQIRIVAYQQQIRATHHKKVKSREF